MEGRTPLVSREDLDTKRRRNQDQSIRKYHNDPLEGHGGTAKTTELVSRQYYWPGMRETIKRYVKNCDMCQWSKVVRHAPYGMLQSNEVPDPPWKSIAMDFLTDLPNSEG